MWRQSLQRVAGKGYQIGNQEFAAFWSGNAQGGDPVQLHRMLRYIAERRRNRDRWEGALAAFDAPLQLVWGMHDPLSGAHVLREARQRYPNASAVELPGVGHWPQLEAPERVAAAIRDFVKNHV
jgi:pimeloyl-ACP methyl ester carboxylesterase